MRSRQRWPLAFVALVIALGGTAASPAGADPSPPSASTPVPTLLATPNGHVTAVSEAIEEHGVYLPVPTNGPGTGYGLSIDPASPGRAAPAAEVKRNGLLRVLPAADSQDGVPVTYDRITASVGRTTRTLPVDDPGWRATETGTYLAAVSLHYTWEAATETGEGNATFWFKLHVPRSHRPAR